MSFLFQRGRFGARCDRPAGWALQNSAMPSLVPAPPPRLERRDASTESPVAYALYQIIVILLDVLWWIIIIQAILSWLIAFNVINLSNDFVRQILMALDRMTAPIYNPIRRVMPDLGALDLSPMVVLLAILIIRQAILPPLFLGVR